MTRWSDDDQCWHWRALDRDDAWRSGTAPTQEQAEADAEMAEQMRAGEPDRHGLASWRTMRWSRREQRMVPNTRPWLPRLPTPPTD